MCIVCVKLVSTCKLAYVISDEAESYLLQLLRIPYLVTSKLQLSCGFYSDGELNQNSFPIPQNSETQPTQLQVGFSRFGDDERIEVTFNSKF